MIFISPNRSTAKQRASSNHPRLNSSADSHSSSQLAVMDARQMLMELSLRPPMMLSNVRTLWRTLLPRAPRASSKNAHWTWTWPPLPVAWLEPSQRKLNHRSAQWFRKPVARRRRSSRPSSPSSDWLNWRLPLSPSLPSSELPWSPRRLWSSPSSPSSCRNSCSSRNCCRKERVRVLKSEDFWMPSIASALTANRLVNNSPTQDTNNTKLKLLHKYSRTNEAKEWRICELIKGCLEDSLRNFQKLPHKFLLLFLPPLHCHCYCWSTNSPPTFYSRLLFFFFFLFFTNFCYTHSPPPLSPHTHHHFDVFLPKLLVIYPHTHTRTYAQIFLTKRLENSLYRPLSKHTHTYQIVWNATKETTKFLITIVDNF